MKFTHEAVERKNLMVSNFARITRFVAFCLTASLSAGAVQAADPVKIGFAGPMLVGRVVTFCASVRAWSRPGPALP